MGHLQHIRHLRHLSHVFGAQRLDVLTPTDFAGLMTASAPLSWWRMASTADEVGGVTLILTGAPSQSAVGAIKNDSNTCTLNSSVGSMFVTTANTAALNVEGSLTVAGWFRRTRTGVMEELVRYAPANFSPYQFFIGVGDTLGFNYPFERSGPVGATSLAVGTWYHLAATRSGTTVTLYVNGVADGSATMAANTNPGTAGVSIMESFGGWGDEIAIWNRALTAAELLALYAAGAKTMVSVTQVSDLGSGVIAWDFDTRLSPVPDSLTAAQCATLEVFSGSEYGGPVDDDIAVNMTPPFAGLTMNYVGTSGNPWRIISDGPALNFGPSKYLRVPSSGVVGS